MRGVTYSLLIIDDLGVISTHTPHARRDPFAVSKPKSINISTHTPHARRDLYLV